MAGIWDAVNTSVFNPEKPNAPGVLSDVRRASGQFVSGVGSTLRDVGAEELGRGIEQYGVGVTRRNPSEIQSFEDVLRRPFTTAREAVGEIVPQVGIAVGGTLAGRAVGGLLGAPLGPLGILAGQQVGGVVGGLLPIAAQTYGGIRSEQRAQGIDDRPRALGATIPAAALERLGAERIAGKLVGEGTQFLARETGESLWKAIGKQAARGGLEETITEIPQTALERFGAYKPLTSPEAVDEYGVAGAKAFLGGAAVRGGLSAVAGQRGLAEESDLTKPLDTTTRPDPSQFVTQDQTVGLKKFIDETTGVVRPSRKEYEKQFAAAFDEPSGQFVADAATGVERELTVGELMQRGSNAMDLTDANPATTAAANIEAAKVATTRDPRDVFLRDELKVIPNNNSRQLFTLMEEQGVDPTSPAMVPVWNYAAAKYMTPSRLTKATELMDAAIIQSSKEAPIGTGISTVQQPAGGVGVGGPVVQRALGDAGRPAPVAGAMGGSAPTTGAPLQQTSILPVATGQPSTTVTTTAPAVALGQPSTTGAPSGTQAPQTIQTAPQGQTTTTVPAAAPIKANTTLRLNQQEKLQDNVLGELKQELAALEGQTQPSKSDLSRMQELRDQIEYAETNTQLAEQRDFTETDLNDLIDEQVGKGKNADRDRQILRAYITARRAVPSGYKGNIAKEIADSFGIAESRVRQIGNPEKLADIAVSMGFDRAQVFDRLGIQSAQKALATELGKLEGELTRLKAKVKPTKADTTRMAELDEQITRINDEVEAGDMAAAFKEAGIEGEAGEAFGNLDDAREWQKASTAGSQMAVKLVSIADTIAELKTAAAELNQLGLAQAEAAAAERIKELTAEYQAIVSGYEAKPEAAAPKKGKGKGKAAEKASEEKDAAKEAEAAKFRAERAAKLQADRNGLAVGDTVKNPKLGTGVVKSFAGDGDATTVTVAFQSGQTKELSVKLAKLEKTDAVQVESPAGVSVQPKAETGEKVGRQVRRAPKPATEGKAQVPAVILTQAEQAAQAWDVVAADFPEAPKFADLTKAQQNTFIGFGEGNWERGDVELELTKLARAAAPKVEKSITPDTTDEQRKTANDLAKDVGGTVVWQEGPLALIRGYSMLSGQPIYAAAIGSSRTRVDVETFTGNAITPEQKTRLVKVKKDLEEADAKQHASNPFVKFDANGLATSNNVDPRLVGVIAGWKNLLNLKAKIYVTTIDDARADKDKFTGPHRAVGSAGLDANEAGSMRKMGDGYYIAFTKGTSYLKMLETIAHEMGHVHQREAFDNADPATQKAIRAEHDKFVQENAGKTGKQFVEALRARTTGRSTQLPAGMQASELTPYWKSFSEWYADQVSKWATTSEKPTTVVEKFFSKLGVALKKFYYSLKGAKYLPNETMKKFLDAVADRTIVIDAKSADTNTRSEAMFVGINSLRTLPKERAANAKANLARAKILDAAGESATDVYMDTGWFKGPDGKWRAEIIDRGVAKLKQDPSTFEVGKLYDLTDVLDHSELFLRYPAMRDLNVVTDDNMEPGNASIDLNKWVLTMSPEESRGSSHLATVLHEVQHIVQELEGFAQGGSPDSVNPFDRKNLVKLATSVFEAKNPDFKYLQQIRELAASDKRQKAADLFDKLQEANQKVYELSAALGVDSSKDSVALEYLKSRTDAGSLGTEYNRASSFISFSLADRIRGDMYRLIAGEMEAFDTEARLTMSDLDLMTTAPKLASAGSSTFIPNRNTGVYARQVKQGLIDRNIAKLPKMSQQPVKRVVESIGDIGGAGLDYVVFTSDLVKRAVAAGLPAAQTFSDRLASRSAKVSEEERKIEKIADRYASIEDDAKGSGPGSVNEFLFESTRTGKWGYGKYRDAKMGAAFDALGPKAQQFVKDVFAHGDATLSNKKKIVLDAANSEYDAMIKAAQDAGDTKTEATLKAEKAATLKRFQTLFRIREGMPYAPIKRTGSYVVIGESAEYQKAKANNDTATLKKLESDPDHYHVSFTDTKWQARSLRDRLAEQGVFTDPQVVSRSESFDEAFSGEAMLPALTKMRAAVDRRAQDSTGKKDPTAGKLLNIINQLYLEALAEGSARKSEMRRRGVAGEVDMLQSFTQQGRADANFLASVEFEPKIQDALQQMRNQSRTGDRERKSEIFDELTKRYAGTLDPQPSPFINALTNMASKFFLASSPGYYLQNLTQPFMMSLPAMAGRHDYTKAAAELAKAYGELGPLFKDVKLFDEQFDFSKVPADVRKAINELVNQGKIDIGLATEINEYKVEADNKLSKFAQRLNKGMRLAVQKVEATNRLSTAIAAYRLEFARTKDAEKATQYAADILTDTHGDYTAFNAPRAFNTQWGKVALQFRKFQLIQIAFYAKLVRDAFTNPAERAAAMKTLAYSLSHTAVFAGMMGLPGYAAISFMLGLFGDEDEPYDLTAEMRKALGPEWANIIMRGAPTVVGMDLSGKIGAGNMLSLMPFSDADLRTNAGRAEAVGTLIGGAALGMTSRIIDGLGLIVSGDYYKGVERVMPKGVSDALKAARQGAEGMTRRNGDVVLPDSEISALDTAFTALGVPVAEQNVTYERQNRMRDLTKNFQDRTTRIKNDYAKAVREKDTAAMAEARTAWTKLQQARQRNGLTPQPVSSLLKAPQEQKAREQRTVGGVQYREGQRKLAESVAAD